LISHKKINTPICNIWWWWWWRWCKITCHKIWDN